MYDNIGRIGSWGRWVNLGGLPANQGLQQLRLGDRFVQMLVHSGGEVGLPELGLRLAGERQDRHDVAGLSELSGHLSTVKPGELSVKQNDVEAAM